MTDQKSYSLLVVEDNVEEGELYKHVFEKAGYRVKIARNYQNAVDVLRSETFDVAVIDIRLDENDPENADGLRVVAQINKLENRPQAILATGQIEKITQAWEDSVFKVWIKSESMETLLKQIEMALETRKELTPAKIKNSLNTIIGRMARERLHLEQVLDLVLNEMTALIKVGPANLSIVDENKIKIKATTEKKEGLNKEFNVENSVAGLAVRRQKTVHFPDIENDELAKTLFKPALGEDKRKGSEFAVPIIIDLEAIAVINFESPQKYAFKETDIALIEELAGQLAIVINSARLQDQTNKVKRLSEISSELNASIIDEEDITVAGIAVEKMLEFMRCEKAAIFNYDIDKSKIDFVAHRGLSKEYLQSDLSQESARALIALTQEPVIVPDIDQDERFASVSDVAHAEGFRSLLELPLRVRGKLVGSMAAYYKDVHDFESEELALNKLFADHVAIALNIARQYEDLEIAKKSQKMAAIGELSGDIVHRMNSPLGAIRANLEIICDDYREILSEKPDLAGIIEHLQSLTEGAIHMVREMREKARGQVLKNVDVVATINIALKEMKIPENIKIENHLQTLNPVTIRANQNLSKVFKNLIGNACDAMPEGGKLILDSQITSQYIDISVQDTGVGISDDFRDEIFDILSVFSKKRKDGGGHGLGLWYCRAYVEACGGELPDPESTVGQGSKFTVRFPLVVE
jgi:signal transduction histidine kinase/CheY-like chemotaxis protein/putative methionine-R-sulfoxide reductase with GAF domain